MSLEPPSARPPLAAAAPPSESGGRGGTSVLVAGEHPVVRAGLCHLLCAGLGCRIIGEASDADRLVSLARHYAPDLTVLELPSEGSGDSVPRSQAWLGTVPTLRQDVPQGRILVVCARASHMAKSHCHLAGAHGFVQLTDTAATDLCAAAEAVLAGGEWFQDDEGESSADPQPQTEAQELSIPLTRRERQVLVYVADGKTSRQIAILLGISPRTVEAHRESIARKLGVSSVAGLTRYVVQHDLGSDRA